MPDSFRRKVSARVRHPAVQEMFLQLRHPVIWGSYVPIFALVFIAIPLDLIGFEQCVTWTCTHLSWRAPGLVRGTTSSRALHRFHCAPLRD